MSFTYQTNYSKYIEKLYGIKRNIHNDLNLINSNNLNLPHNYVINNRTDLTAIETYSIDPDGCEDADDAFSIYQQNDKLYLAIHIADPTEYININSALWQDVENRIITKYPSNTKPIHMLPNSIMEKASLMDNAYGNIKNAITVLTEIDKDTFLPENNIKLLFTKIKVKRENTLSYQTASENIIEPIQYGLNISLALQEKRSEKTLGTKLKSVSTSIIKYDNNKPNLYIDTPNEKRMKQMIEEFAIFANSFIGEYLKINLNGYGIFRTCDASSLLNNDEFKNITGDDLLHHIITNGIKADYMDTVSAHDLVGSNEYTHFTSPIRRASDCVCHYLLKFLHLKNTISDIDIPFDKDKLEILSAKCLAKTREMKKIQYKDTKFRLIQVMNEIIKEKNELDIQYYITSYVSSFINIIINKMDDYPVYLSYSLKRNEYIDCIDNKQIYNLKITTVNCITKFDEGSIPELDELFP